MTGTAQPTLGALLHDASRRLAAAEVEDATLEADVLLRHALGLGSDRAHFFAMLGDVAPRGVASAFDALVGRRIAHEPTAYIIGRREFYGLEFECTPAALIPRPETELLVDSALAWLEAVRGAPPFVIDVGTGTGAVAVTIAVHRPDATVLALDVSRDALALAARNARRHGVDERCRFVAGDLLSPVGARADVIVANLPYISEADAQALAPEIRSHEPAGALVGGAAGTEIIERLLIAAPAAMAPASLLVCECGDRQGAALRAAAIRAFPDARVEVRKDLAGLDRMLYIER